MQVGSARVVDALFGGAVTAVAGAFLHESGRIRPTPFDILGSAYFPRMVAVGLFILGCILMARSALGVRTESTEISLLSGGDEAGGERRPLAAAVIFVLTACYAAALAWSPIGFIAPTAAFLAAAGFALTDRTRTAAIRCAAVGIVLACLLSLLFKTLLGVALP